MAVLTRLLLIGVGLLAVFNGAWWVFHQFIGGTVVVVLGIIVILVGSNAQHV